MLEQMLIPVNFHAEEPRKMQDIAVKSNSTTAATISLVHTLMCHRQGGESEGFCQSAIESLLKKLKGKRNQVESLMTVITTGGTEPSKCVTIHRTLDGRLQVAGRKCFPHVIYAKIWRWPDLHKNELKHIKSCQFAFDLKCDSVCVNPYHYERVVTSSIGLFVKDISTLMRQAELHSGSPEMSDDSTISYNGLGTNSVTNSHQQDYQSSNPSPNSASGDSWNDCIGPNNVQHQGNFVSLNNSQQNQMPVSHYGVVSQSLELEDGGNAKTIQDHTMDQLGFTQFETTDQMYGSTTPPQCVLQSLSPKSLITPSEPSPTTSVIQAHQNGFPISTTSSVHNVISPAIYGLTPQSLASVNIRNAVPMQAQTMNQLYGSTTPPQRSIQSISPNLGGSSARLPSSTVNHVQQTGYPVTTAVNSYNISTGPQWKGANTLTHTQNTQITDNRLCNPAYWGQRDEDDARFDSLMTTLPAPEYWCSVGYYELDNNVGEMFKVKKSCPMVTVDGYVNPSEGHRFCLGALSNVHRTEQSEKVRMHIGKGLTLDVRDEGDVWLSCQSDHSLFLQSYHLDTASGLVPGTYVHKIHPLAYIKVFDLRQCYKQMRERAVEAQKAAASQAAAVAGHVTNNPSVQQNLNAAAGIGVDDLRRFCILRLSFVKGWGPDYPRPSIKDTPCWIEVHLHRALQLLDNILHTTPINVKTRITE